MYAFGECVTAHLDVQVVTPYLEAGMCERNSIKYKQKYSLNTHTSVIAY